MVGFVAGETKFSAENSRLFDFSGCKSSSGLESSFPSLFQISHSSGMDGNG